MKHLLLGTIFLASCSAQPLPISDEERQEAIRNLSDTAAEIERGCELEERSLLQPNPRGHLELRPVDPANFTYQQFECVMAAIDKAKLQDRGIRVLLIGEEAAR